MEKVMEVISRDGPSSISQSMESKLDFAVFLIPSIFCSFFLNQDKITLDWSENYLLYVSFVV